MRSISLSKFEAFLVRLFRRYDFDMTENEKTPLDGLSQEDRILLTDALGRMLRVTSEFQGQSMEAREKAREEFRDQEREDDNVMRILIDGQMAGVIEKMMYPILIVDEALSYQLSVSASFMRTHFIISDLIMGGDLIEAITLIRKQLESLARLNEIDSAPLEKLYGRTPNISSVLKAGRGQIYGQLSEVAHFSKPHYRAKAF